MLLERASLSLPAACNHAGVIAVAVLCQLTVPGLPVALRLRWAARPLARRRPGVLA